MKQKQTQNLNEKDNEVIIAKEIKSFFMKMISKLINLLFRNIKKQHQVMILVLNLVGIFLAIFIDFNSYLNRLVSDEFSHFWLISFFLLPFIISFTSSLLVSSFKEKICYSFESIKIFALYSISPLFGIIPSFEFLGMGFFVKLILLIPIIPLAFVGSMISFIFNKIDLKNREKLFKKIYLIIIILTIFLITLEYPSLVFSLTKSCVIEKNGCGWECSESYYSSSEMCEKIILSVTSHYKYCAFSGESSCYSKRAIEMRDMKGCLQIDVGPQWGEFERDICLRRILEQNPDIKFCNYYPIKEKCFYDLSHILEDTSYCNFIVNNPQLKNDCYKNNL